MRRRPASVWRSDWPSRLRIRRISRLVDPKTGLFAGGSGSGMIITVFVVWKVFNLLVYKVSKSPDLLLSRREMLCAIPPTMFSSENFLSGMDNRRDRLIRAQSGLK